MQGQRLLHLIHFFIALKYFQTGKWQKSNLSEKILWIWNWTGRDGSSEVVKDQTCWDKRSSVWLDGKSQRQACCSCYWWYVTLEPHLSFINTSKEAIRSDTVNRKSRPMTIWLHDVHLDSVCVLHVFSNQGKTFRWSSLECGSVKDAPSGECKLIYGPPPEIGQNTQVLKDTLHFSLRNLWWSGTINWTMIDANKWPKRK